MLSKNAQSSILNLISALFIGVWFTPSTQAQVIQCDKTQRTAFSEKLCSDNFNEIRQELNETTLSSYLVTDAPIRLIRDTHQLWFNRLKTCKTGECFRQQFDLRIEDLKSYSSVKQTLTQHYLKYENGVVSRQPVHLKIHQLSKDKIKIEGLAYRSPNNRSETQIIALQAYSSTDRKNEIIDNEHDCKYQLNFQKALLIISTQQSGCERFNGIYRLYD